MKQFSKNAIHAFEIHGDKVILTKPYELTIDDWQLLMNRFNRLGYGLSDVDQTIDVYEKLTQEGERGGSGYILQPDQAEAVLDLFGKDELKVCVIYGMRRWKRRYSSFWIGLPKALTRYGFKKKKRWKKLSSKGKHNALSNCQ